MNASHDDVARSVVRTLHLAGRSAGEGMTIQAIWACSGLRALHQVQTGIHRAAELGWVVQRPDNGFVLLTEVGAELDL